MSDTNPKLKTIPQLTPAGPLTGTELVPLSQSGQTRMVDIDGIADFVIGSDAVSGIASFNAGTTAPAGAVKGTPWLDTSTTPLHVLKLYDGTDWISLGTIDITNNRFAVALRYMAADTLFARLGTAGLEQAITLAALKAALGVSTPILVQRAFASLSTQTSITTVIPFDATIPQSSEGTSLLSASITPLSATNKLRITAKLNVGMGSAAAAACAAIFMGASADAIDAAAVYISATEYGQINLVTEIVAGSTSARTIALRAGPSSGTLYINRVDAAATIFGGVSKSTLTVEELIP